MLPYIITAILSATITALVMSCFLVERDPCDDVQQLPKPRHEPAFNDPAPFKTETFGIVNVHAETFLNREELDNLSRPDPQMLIADRLKRGLADSVWEFATVSRCDDPINCRTHYLATIKVVNTGSKNPVI